MGGGGCQICWPFEGIGVFVLRCVSREIETLGLAA